MAPKRPAREQDHRPAPPRHPGDPKDNAQHQSRDRFQPGAEFAERTPPATRYREKQESTPARQRWDTKSVNGRTWFTPKTGAKAPTQPRRGEPDHLSHVGRCRKVADYVLSPAIAKIDTNTQTSAHREIRELQRTNMYNVEILSNNSLLMSAQKPLKMVKINDHHILDLTRSGNCRHPLELRSISNRLPCTWPIRKVLAARTNPKNEAATPKIANIKEDFVSPFGHSNPRSNR